MKIYSFEGNGIYLGSAVVVAAPSKQAALTLINTELKNSGIRDANLATIEAIVRHRCDKPCIILSNNGDY